MSGEKVPRARQVSANPLAGWFQGFRQDFRFSPAWFKAVVLSAAALIWKLITKAPLRLGRLLQHLIAGVWGALRWGLIDTIKILLGTSPAALPGPKSRRRSAPPETFEMGLRLWLRSAVGSSLAWSGRLITKSMDLIGVGELVDLVTVLIKINTRPLTPMELAEARRVFGDSLTYWRIRLDEWSLIAHIGKWVAERRARKPVGDMAVTVFSTVHFTRRVQPRPGNSDMAWLIHELTHVAQMEHIGSQFMAEALHAQSAEGYAYGGPQALIGRQLREFNREQQGDIARDYYLSLFSGAELSDAHRRAFARIIEQLQRGQL